MSTGFPDRVPPHTPGHGPLENEQLHVLQLTSHAGSELPRDASQFPKRPTIREICSAATMPIYAITRPSSGLHLTGVSVSRPRRDAAISALSFSYASEPDVAVEVTSGQAVDIVAALLQFARVYSIEEEWTVGSALSVSLPGTSVTSIMHAAEGFEWIAQCEVHDGRILLAAHNLPLVRLPQLLAAIERIDNRPDLMQRAQREWKRKIRQREDTNKR